MPEAMMSNELFSRVHWVHNAPQLSKQWCKIKILYIVSMPKTQKDITNL